MQNEKRLTVAIAGFGTVGTGVVRVLEESAELIRQRIGRPIFVKSVLVRHATKERACALPEGAVLTTDPAHITDDAEVDVVLELMGGIEEAGKLIGRALEQGKHVVTANKALLAEAGEPLFALAAEKKLSLLYEASVAGAIPIVQTLKESLAGNNISSLLGILNGTSNYILSEMTTEGLDFDTALQGAQDAGYAEADPTLDIDGHDAAHKLVLLIRLAYGVEYPYKDMPIYGIRHMSKMDIAFAREFGYRIKLLGQVRSVDGKLEAGVFPTLVHHRFLLASVGGSYNAIRMEGNAIGSLFLHGRGAGDMPTASSVVADLMAVARDALPHNTGFIAQVLRKAVILPPPEARSCYYLRVMVQDCSGVLRDLAGIMAEENISIAQVIQKPEEQGAVPLVFMSHEATAAAMDAALAKITNNCLLVEPAVCYRVLA